MHGQNLIADLKDEHLLRCMYSARHKEVKDLTDSEQVAICFFAGAELEFVSEECQVTIKTRNPCGIVKIDGKFQVFERKS